MAWPMMALPADAESVVAVAILSTVWFSSFEVLWAKSPLPENFAVTWYDPAAKEDVVSVALPPDKAAVPSARVPFSNVTVPVAVAGDTVALNVTGSPTVEGSCEDWRAVEVGAWSTTCFRMADVLDLSFASPE